MCLPLATASWGSQMDLIAESQEGNVLELDRGDNDVIMNLLISEEEEEDDVFAALARTMKPSAPAASSARNESGTPATPSPSPVLLDVHKYTAAQLDVHLPVPVAEALRSPYEGKKLPLARSSKTQPLPIFPELLEELAHSWTDCPYSSWSPISGASTLDCEAMEKLGLLHLPPMKLLVAAHIHPAWRANPTRATGATLLPPQLQRWPGPCRLPLTRHRRRRGQPDQLPLQR